jgi:hypothetical protein
MGARQSRTVAPLALTGVVDRSEFLLPNAPTNITRRQKLAMKAYLKAINEGDGITRPNEDYSEPYILGHYSNIDKAFRNMNNATIKEYYKMANDEIAASSAATKADRQKALEDEEASRAAADAAKAAEATKRAAEAAERAAARAAAEAERKIREAPAKMKALRAAAAEAKKEAEKIKQTQAERARQHKLASDRQAELDREQAKLDAARAEVERLKANEVAAAAAADKAKADSAAAARAAKEAAAAATASREAAFKRGMEITDALKGWRQAENTRTNAEKAEFDAVAEKYARIAAARRGLGLRRNIGALREIPADQWGYLQMAKEHVAAQFGIPPGMTPIQIENRIKGILRASLEQGVWQDIEDDNARKFLMSFKKGRVNKERSATNRNTAVNIAFMGSPGPAAVANAAIPEFTNIDAARLNALNKLAAGNENNSDENNSGSAVSGSSENSSSNSGNSGFSLFNLGSAASPRSRFSLSNSGSVASPRSISSLSNSGSVASGRSGNTRRIRNQSIKSALETHKARSAAKAARDAILSRKRTSSSASNGPLKHSNSLQGTRRNRNRKNSNTGLATNAAQRAKLLGATLTNNNSNSVNSNDDFQQLPPLPGALTNAQMNAPINRTTPSVAKLPLPPVRDPRTSRPNNTGVGLAAGIPPLEYRPPTQPLQHPPPPVGPPPPRGYRPIITTGTRLYRNPGNPPNDLYTLE